MNAFVVVAACNFDDVLLGVFPSDDAGEAAAKTLAAAVAADPSQRLVTHMASDTHLVRVVVFEVRDSTTITEYASFDPVVSNPKRKAKAKTC